jgi:hypothetical protein
METTESEKMHEVPSTSKGRVLGDYWPGCRSIGIRFGCEIHAVTLNKLREHLL